MSSQRPAARAGLVGPSRTSPTRRPWTPLSAAAVDRFGRIDGLFAVAGGSGRRFGDGPIHEVSDEGWDRTLGLNLRTQA